MSTSRVFVCYSHLDKRWLDQKHDFALIPWLEKMLQKDNIELWYDRSGQRGLEAGDKFRMEIEKQIDQADCAVLMVSEAFFSSDFIQAVEVPRILSRAERGEMVVIPILLEPCDWEDFEFVRSRQMTPGEPTPLIDYTESDRKWVHGRYEILKAIRRRVPKEPSVPEPGRELPPPKEPVAARIGFFVQHIATMRRMTVAIAAMLTLSVIIGAIFVGTIFLGPQSSKTTSKKPNVQGRLFWNEKPFSKAEVKLVALPGDKKRYAQTHTDDNKPPGKAYRTTADDQGNYAFDVPPGKYLLYYRDGANKAKPSRQIEWTIADYTPLFTINRRVNLPLILKKGKAIVINDINAIKAYELAIIFPQAHGSVGPAPQQRQKLSPSPVFKWREYPFAKKYSVWIYKTNYEKDKGYYYSVPVENGDTRETTYTPRSPLQVHDDYELWVIAYSSNGYELADGRAGFGVEQ